MKINLIWAIAEGETNTPWLVDAWDEYSIDGNHYGWEQAVAKAGEEYGGRNIRVTTIEADYDKAVAAFLPADVTPSGAAA